MEDVKPVADPGEIAAQVVDGMVTLFHALMDRETASPAVLMVAGVSDDGKSLDTTIIEAAAVGVSPNTMALASRATAQNAVNVGASVVLVGGLTTFYHRTGDEEKTLDGALVLMEDARRRYAEGFVVEDGERLRLEPSTLDPKLVDDAFGHLIGNIKWPALF
ncbi:MAG: hypothetical protein ACREJ6_06680 [Candidatus Methylomirabilis sp.]